MPSPDGGTRAIPDFSRTFLGDPVLSTGMAVPSTADSTFPQRMPPPVDKSGTSGRTGGIGEETSGKGEGPSQV